MDKCVCGVWARQKKNPGTDDVLWLGGSVFRRSGCWSMCSTCRSALRVDRINVINSADWLGSVWSSDRCRSENTAAACLTVSRPHAGAHALLTCTCCYMHNNVCSRWGPLHAWTVWLFQIWECGFRQLISMFVWIMFLCWSRTCLFLLNNVGWTIKF